MNNLRDFSQSYLRSSFKTVILPSYSWIALVGRMTFQLEMAWR
jgi:hypothetical protein